jgi:hypothetical protein
MEPKGKETNLVVGGVLEEEDGVGELGFDHVVPEPLHRGTVGDVGRVGRPGTAGELGDEVVVGADDCSSRVPTSRERTGIVIIWEDRRLDRVEVAVEAVAAFVGLKSIETTDGSERRVAALDDESRGVALNVLAVRLLDVGGGENDFEQIHAIFGVIKLGGHVIPRVQATHESARLNHRA